MSGRFFMSAFIIGVLIFGAAMWYFQVYAYYETVEDIETVQVQGRAVSVSDYRGIDATTSPNKLRGCFTVDPQEFEGVPLAENPEPLTPPSWFDCFDAEQLSRDLASGAATAYLAGDETPEGAVGYEVVRMIAVYPDGRAYLWRHYREN